MHYHNTFFSYISETQVIIWVSIVSANGLQIQFNISSIYRWFKWYLMILCIGILSMWTHQAHSKDFLREGANYFRQIFFLNINNFNGNQSIIKPWLLCNMNYTLENIRISKHLNLDRNLNINYDFVDENVDYEYFEKE